MYDTYGRFPGGTDAMHLMCDADPSHRNRLFGPGAYEPAHAAHLATWHPRRHDPIPSLNDECA
jgi:hypothetical protein